MNNFNCIERSEFIRDEYKEYLRASFNFGTGKLQKMFVEQLQNEELFKGPYVSMDLPFKRGDNLNGLIANGIVCSSFAKLGNIDLERPLYSHQESAIKRIAKGRGAIVTTGTGSGKTECFLYPILNEILKDYENGIREIGIRAIFLYPMNALVNDQMDRIRKILATFPEITFGFFTGDTPEDGGERRRKKYAEDHKDDDDVISRKILDNELITREEIRENPPHLLFTNYSMLEYLMIRPHDYKLFQSDFIGNWKYVVLDEAHTYTGALGIEISMLMRRLTANAEKKPHFILTSATLGKQGESEKDIVSFAHNLTSEDFIEDDIIFSKRIYMPADVFEYQVAGGDYLELIRNIKDTEKVKSICRKYTAIYENEVPENIYELLSRDSNVYLLYNELIGGSKTFNALYGRFSEILKKEELLALIDLVNQSSQNGIELFNLKYHSFVRPLNIRRYVIDNFGYDLSRTCDEIRPTYHHVETCQQTVPEAIIAFLEGEHFTDVIRTAVSLGGDCDTLTDIAAAMGEAYYGCPEELRNECEKRIEKEMRKVLRRFVRARQTVVAVKADWKTEPMPEQKETFILKRSFTKEELANLRRGNVPQEMEDKWFFYMKRNRLYAHRSWTGIMIFMMKINPDGDEHKVTVNRFPEQYSCTSIEEDRDMLNNLLNWWTQDTYDYYNEWLEETVNNLKKAGRIPSDEG